MSVRCEWFVLCEREILDANTHQMSLIGCLEQVSALEFPSLRHGFACVAQYRWVGEPLSAERGIEHRIWRLSEHEPPEQILSCAGRWSPVSPRLRFRANFGFLRLKRVETLRFRLDHRLDGGEWEEGPTVSLDIEQLHISKEQLQQFEAEMSARGLPTTQPE